MTNTRPLLTVSQCMTRSPHCIGLDQTLDLAAQRMSHYGIRHLPVLDGGQLVGMLSERDIALLRSVVPDQLQRMIVEEAMTGVPYCVEPDALVSEVAQHMALRKLGSAIVVDGGKVIGMFTTTDALRALSLLLEDRVPISDDRSRIESIAP